MSYELILLRHGKSDWSTDESDFNRPVTDRGKRGAQRIGIWLAQNELIPDRVISSPAERAKITAQKMMKAMGRTDHNIIYDNRIYDASLDELLEVLYSIPKKTKRLLLVGHNPGLEDLLYYLAHKEIPLSDDGKLLTTATAARLLLSDSWHKITARCADLIRIQRAKELPKKFPYPTFDSNEYRIRPAYYYTQSSVIPYRYNQGKLEVLLILSSKKKHLVIPKGIHEPGLSARESAAKEALEEAGVKGNVAQQPIGTYSYNKWQAQCTVSVYPMEVTDIVDVQLWEESHRGRQWLTADLAAQKIYQQALKPMLLNLSNTLDASK